MMKCTKCQKEMKQQKNFLGFDKFYCEFCNIEITLLPKVTMKNENLFTSEERHKIVYALIIAEENYKELSERTTEPKLKKSWEDKEKNTEKLRISITSKLVKQGVM